MYYFELSFKYIYLYTYVCYFSVKICYRILMWFLWFKRVIWIEEKFTVISLYTESFSTLTVVHKYWVRRGATNILSALSVHLSHNNTIQHDSSPLLVVTHINAGCYSDKFEYSLPSLAGVSWDSSVTVDVFFHSWCHSGLSHVSS